MKKEYFLVKKLIVYVIIFSLFSGLAGCKASTTDYSIPYVKTEGEHPANLQQIKSKTYVDSTDGKLFVCAKHTRDATFRDKVVSIGADGINTVIKLDAKIAYHGMYGGHFYYSAVDKDFEYDFYCVNLATGEQTLLCENNDTISSPNFIDTNDNILFPEGISANRFLAVQGSSLDGRTQLEPEYIVGNNKYVFTEFSKLKQINPQGEDTLIMQHSYDCYPIRYQDGLLLHTGKPGALLSYLSSDGELKNLFSIESDAIKSTINFHEDQIFLSVLRVRMGPKNLAYVPYEDDSISGTYRIDMEDYSVTKISAATYSGIYIFNGENLYCVDDNGNIVILDFNGTVLQEIIC